MPFFQYSIEVKQLLLEVYSLKFKGIHNKLDTDNLLYLFIITICP